MIKDKYPLYHPYREAELMWMHAACVYEHFPQEQPLMSDAAFDKLSRGLLYAYEALSTYFKHTVDKGSLAAGSAIGINWADGIGLLAYNTLAAKYRVDEPRLIDIV